MNVWRMIAHHENPAGAIDWSIAAGKLGVGWGSVGDLRDLAPETATDISGALPAVYPDLRNKHLGGPSLWNFFKLIQIGDLVIVSTGRSRSHVAEITGEYLFASARDSFGDYFHQRAAVVTDHDADRLWASLGGKVAKHNSIRWTVALCDKGSAASDMLDGIVYSEGTRFEVTASVVERNLQARAACLRHHGHRCLACDLDFGEQYGDLGIGFIHVHHLSPFSGNSEGRHVDPKSDLVPLCPNCHAMVHRKRPPATVEELVELLRHQK